MSYATATDLITRFGPEEVAQRAAPEGTRVSGALLQLTVSDGDRASFSADEIAAADAALVRINGLIADASAVIDSYLSERDTVPMDPAPPVLTRLACDIARYDLYDDAVDPQGTIAARYTAAIKMLTAIAAGTIKLGDATADESSNPVLSPSANSAGRTITQAGLGDYMGRFGS